jgi:putative MATE family efflux protein
MAMYGKPMTAGAPWKHIANFAFPILCGLLLQQLYNTVDMVVVGNFSGQNELAAVGTTGTMVFMFLAVAIGFSAGNGVVVAQHFGAGRDREVRDSAASGILLLLALGAGASVIGIVFSRFAYVKVVSVPENILDSTLRYFRIYCAGLVFQFGYNILAAILRAVGDSAATLYFLLTAAILNILLDLLFVGAFRWGSAGAAVATDIAQAGSMLAAWSYMARKYPVFRFKLRELVWKSALVRETLRVGSPIALQLVIVSLGLTLIQRAVNSFGEVMTAAFSVGHRVELYLHLPCNAIQTTLATYTGQNIGAGRMDRVKLGARQGLTISILLTAIISVPVWIFAARIVTFFALEGTATEYCIAYLRALALVNVILASYVPLFGVFQGNRHTGIPTVVALCALTTRVIVTYLWKDSAFFGASIIWWNGAFGFCAGCLVSWIYFLSGRWKVRPTDR